MSLGAIPDPRLRSYSFFAVVDVGELEGLSADTPISELTDKDVGRIAQLFREAKFDPPSADVRWLLVYCWTAWAPWLMRGGWEGVCGAMLGGGLVSIADRGVQSAAGDHEGDQTGHGGHLSRRVRTVAIADAVVVVGLVICLGGYAQTGSFAGLPCEGCE